MIWQMGISTVGEKELGRNIPRVGGRENEHRSL